MFGVMWWPLLCCYSVREDNLSDHEEEFYYEEIEMSDMDVMTSNMEGKITVNA